jgi:hypothetical protein
LVKHSALCPRRRLAPTTEDTVTHVLLIFRNITKVPSSGSAIGLGVNALHTVRVLRRAGVEVDAAPAAEPRDVHRVLAMKPTVTHCVLEAPWVCRAAMIELLQAFPRVHFVVRSHSQIGFLQVEPSAIQLLRELLVLQENALNLTVAANSSTLKHFFETAYGGHTLYLPNLYDFERVHRKRASAHSSRLLRIGSFGALRLLKNHTTAAAAALMLARKRGCDLEFSVSLENETMGGGSILDALRKMFDGLEWATLVAHPWQDWANFRRTVSSMDLCLQVSMTETFNITTADAVAEGVPSVVSPTVEWAPDYWKADTDRLEDIVRIGGALLSSPEAAADGLEALASFAEGAVARWLAYLNGPPSRYLAA